ncbi:hypothetical protein [Glycomyces salinus]|uniref:hypothetical protein n=1 Tax=Glycomyces salinus TaxID=980294 RepID=UPI0018EBC281|nr:hypothetical protein [Glycomyces salinus]
MERPTRHESILLFDADCAPCSRVAKQLRALNVSGLETKSLNDPELGETLTRAGQEIPDKPTLLEIDGGSVKLYQGLPMRLKLAKRIGFRKAGAIVGLLAGEARARTERAGEHGRKLTRRRLMGGAAAAGVGAVVLGTAAPANATPSEPGAVRTLSVDEARRLRETDIVEQSLRVWGDSDREDIKVIAGAEGRSIAMIVHRDPTTATFVDLADLEHGVTMQIDAESRSLRYFLPGGTALGEVSKVGDRVEVTEIDNAYVPTAAEIEPQFSVTCFITCMAGEADVDCALSCFDCVFGGPLDKAIGCPICAICAGSAGLSCARQCN